jgi:hypothetical protein
MMPVFFAVDVRMTMLLAAAGVAVLVENGT